MLVHNLSQYFHFKILQVFCWHSSITQATGIESCIAVNIAMHGSDTAMHGSDTAMTRQCTAMTLQCTATTRQWHCNCTTAQCSNRVIFSLDYTCHGIGSYKGVRNLLQGANSEKTIYWTQHCVYWLIMQNMTTIPRQNFVFRNWSDLTIAFTRSLDLIEFCVLRCSASHLFISTVYDLRHGPCSWPLLYPPEVRWTC